MRRSFSRLRVVKVGQSVTKQSATPSRSGWPPNSSPQPGEVRANFNNPMQCDRPTANLKQSASWVSLTDAQMHECHVMLSQNCCCQRIVDAQSDWEI